MEVTHPVGHGNSMQDISDNMFAIVAALLALLTSAATLIQSIVKSRRESGKVDAETSRTKAEVDETEAKTANLYEDALQKSVARVATIEARICLLEDRIVERDERIEALSAQNAAMMERIRQSDIEKKQLIEGFRVELKERDREIATVKDWAERLVGQVIDLGGTPEPFEAHWPRRRKKGDQPDVEDCE